MNEDKNPFNADDDNIQVNSENTKEALEDLGGGHADIYDEDGDFVEDVEV